MHQLLDVLGFIGRVSAYLGSASAVLLLIAVVALTYAGIKFNSQYDLREKAIVTESNCVKTPNDTYDCRVMYMHQHHGKPVELTGVVKNNLTPIQSGNKMQVAMSSHSNDHRLLGDADSLIGDNKLVLILLFVIFVLVLRYYLATRYDLYAQFNGAMTVYSLFK